MIELIKTNIMKDILIILATNISAMLATAFAGLLAYEGKDGWGWFLFVAILLTARFTYKQSEKDDEVNEE